MRFFCMAASFGMGSMVQANAISESLGFAFDLPAGFIGLVLVVLSGRILFGGIRKIAGAAARLVPVSALLYMAAALGALFVYRENLVSSFVLILTDAFSFHSAAGGALGYGISRAVRYGIARGVFSNEAGLGSMAILNGGVGEAAPGSQGQWAIFEVFFDTIISCTLTALVILCVMGEGLGRFSGNGADLTGFCFAEGLGNPGGYAVSVCVTPVCLRNDHCLVLYGKAVGGLSGRGVWNRSFLSVSLFLPSGRVCRKLRAHGADMGIIGHF